MADPYKKRAPLVEGPADATGAKAMLTPARRTIDGTPIFSCALLARSDSVPLGRAIRVSGQLARADRFDGTFNRGLNA